MKIVVDDLSGPQIAEFLDAHVQQLRETSPPEFAFALDLAGLRRPEITFWSVWDGGTVIGCAALKRLDAEHAELKSMRTAPAHTRTGVASRLLTHVLAEAARMGFTRVSLETGTEDFYLPARRLYEKFGFRYCEPFAGYRPSPHNVYLTRDLTPPG